MKSNLVAAVLLGLTLVAAAPRAFAGNTAPVTQTFNYPNVDNIPIATFGGNGVTTWDRWCQEEGFRASLPGSAKAGGPAFPCCGNANGTGAFTGWDCNINCNFATLAQITCTQ